MDEDMDMSAANPSLVFSQSAPPMEQPPSVNGFQEDRKML